MFSIFKEKRMALALFLLAGSLQAAKVELDQLDIKYSTSGWKTTQKSLSIDGNKLRLNGKEFKSGLGTHAPSLSSIKLDAKAKKFHAIVGVDDEVKKGMGSVEFIVRADGKVLFKSAPMKSGDRPQKIELALTGVRNLVLEVTDAGDGKGSDHANWADAFIEYDGKEPKMIEVEKTSLTIQEKATLKAREYSTAGFFQVDPSVREVKNFNVGWRFHKGKMTAAEKVDFNDEKWAVVNTPHGLELLPLEASGGVNYQGQAWYRKHFEVPASSKGKKQIIHFEAIMGKSKVWINGQLVKEQFGGFLPLHIDATAYLKYGQKNVIAVWADNSNDISFPPGKSQETLDFAYFGGIYRDVYFIEHQQVHISNANAEDKIAGGGLFVHFDKFSQDSATVYVDADINNDSLADEELEISFELKNKAGELVSSDLKKLSVKGGKNSGKVTAEMKVTQPQLWHVDDPYLHNLFVTIKNKAGQKVDAMRLRVGIRKIEFRGTEGFFLNGKHFNEKIIGANRHQDFAYIGNALPNNTHWRDAKKLREASMRLIRNAHYPQDPAFMDACDELGLFVIVNTPGWQFWNSDPIFEKRVYSDIRNMVRRDRNHASTFIWEPILNETWYPSYFAKNVHNMVKEEFPYPGCYTACDHEARGQEHFDIVYEHPDRRPYHKDLPDNEETEKYLSQFYKHYHDRPVFNREWGDNVDNWTDHNSSSRVNKAWGEQAQLIQANHYGRPEYAYSSWESMHKAPKQFFGGALWHSFDHQRGYHPDPFWGGIMDAFRQPKYSYYMFKAQGNPSKTQIENVDKKAFVYIAHELTPFSAKDVVVYSNCDEVRIKSLNQQFPTQKTIRPGLGMPHQPVSFKDAFDFQLLKKLHRSRKAHQGVIIAEGLINGQVVAKMTKAPAGRRTQIILKVDSEGLALQADGSDIVPIVAYIADKEGDIKRLTGDYIKFTVEGEGQLVDDGKIQANPQKVEWGEAVALIRATNKPGKITVKASLLKRGGHMPISAKLVLESVKVEQDFIFSEAPKKATKSSTSTVESSTREKELEEKLEKTLNELNKLKIEAVGKQQEEFEGKDK